MLERRRELAKASLTHGLVTLKPTAGDRTLKINEDAGSNGGRSEQDAAPQAAVAMVVRM